MQQQPEVIFAQLKSSSEPIVVDSMCVECQASGKTTILLTAIPFFKEIILISFYCDECGYKNTETQFGGKLADEGIKIVFKAEHPKDVNRELIKSEYAKITIPELDFEIPANKKGEITTIEGLFTRCIEDLSGEQPVRKYTQPQVYDKIETFISKLNSLITGDLMPFTVIIEDPSGNSFIKNPLAPKADPQLHSVHFHRTPAMLEEMGYSVENAKQEYEQLKKQEVKEQKNEVAEGELVGSHKVDYTAPFSEDNFAKTEGMAFQVECHSCGMMGETRMCETGIPYFQDLIIMSFSCEYCGAHSTETKTSSAIKPKGIKFTIKNPSQKDLKRDLFKSQTCAVEIPELQLQLDYGTLGGVLTTVEGLLQKIWDHLTEHNPFADSDEGYAKRMKKLLDDLIACRERRMQFTLVLVDPLGNSFIQNPDFPKPDTSVLTEEFERTQDQNEFLGLLDMKVENYNEQAPK